MRLSRRTAGRSMVAIGCLGIVMSIAAIVVGHGLIDQVEGSVDDSLVLTSEALGSVSDSIELTTTIVDTIQDGVVNVSSTLGSIEESLDQTTLVLQNSTDFIGGSLPEALESVGEVLTTVETVASSVDGALRALARAPFGPDYDPEQPFDETIADLSTAIEPLPADLRALAADFEGLEGSSADIAADLGALATSVDDLDTQLSEVSVLLDRYATTAKEAEVLAARSRLDLQSSANEAKVLLIVLGIVFALGQLVPIWLGLTLLNESSNIQTLITRSRHDESPFLGGGDGTELHEQQHVIEGLDDAADDERPPEGGTAEHPPGEDRR
jgi:hypothetical protein